MPKLLVCIGVLCISGCRSENKVSLIEQHYLTDNLQVGQVIYVREIINSDDGWMCVLYPYQPYLSKNAPENSRINEYLSSIGYTANESHWAFIIFNSKSIDLSKFKRSNILDILSSNEIQSEHTEKLPTKFKPGNCFPLGVAAITKIKSQGRIFVIVGETK